MDYLYAQSSPLYGSVYDSVGDDEEGASSYSYAYAEPESSVSDENYVYAEPKDGASIYEEQEFEGKNKQVKQPHSLSSSSSSSDDNDLDGGTVDRDWMREMHSIKRDATLSEAQKFQQLSDLYMDFKQIAKHIGKTLIMEKHLPVSKKTIRPLSLGGVAGGEKYVYSSILFKFPCDVELRKGVYLYGGDRPNLEFANKAAGHELKSLDAFASESLALDINNVHVPLMALVDYRGYRLVAIAFLPITHDTLALGSNDGGQTCKNSNLELYDLVSRICGSLGLAKHKVLQVDMPGPGDLECHVGTDNRYYVLDFARLYPPEVEAKVSKSIFYRLFRPEYLKMWWKKSLISSDAFSNWQRADERAKQLNDDAREAATHMREVSTLSCAEHFDRICGGTNRLCFCYDLDL